jgi:hypothetical protein
MHTVDVQKAVYFCIKFIDPTTSKFKIIRFCEHNQDGVYVPDNLNNPKVKEIIAADGKFLKRILLLMSLDLHELY